MEPTDSSVDYFPSSAAHLLAELERIDLLIRVQVSRVRCVDGPQDDFSGLYISEGEVERLLQQPVGIPAWAIDAKALPPHVRVTLDQLRESLERRRVESVHRGIPLRLQVVEDLFGLNAFDRDVLLITLAREIDLRYERLFAYLQDDVSKRSPSIDLVLNLLCESAEAKLANRRRFSADAPLLKYGLISLDADPAHGPAPLLGRFISMDERVVEYLLDDDALDTRLRPFTRCIAPRVTLHDLLLPAQFKQRVRALADDAETMQAGLIVYFDGAQGSGRQALAEAICCAMNKLLLVVDTRGLMETETLPFQTGLRLALREARLQGAVPLFADFDMALSGERLRLETTAVREFQQHGGLTLLAGNNVRRTVEALGSTRFLHIPVPGLGFVQRREFWQRVLSRTPHGAGEVDAADLANKFELTPGGIEDAARTAQNLARWRNSPRGEMTAADLVAACNLHSNARLGALAQRIVSLRTWDDIVLPPDAYEQLREICSWVRHRRLVLGEWGFERKLGLGRGIGVLFAGPSGTGKTMAAEIIAGGLGLDLYKIDLSSVVSKYIGETEKNLARIFAEAETSNAILFFDEADALFGKRSEVKDAHDRYANIETSFLLQRIEEYPGIAILATNLRKNMDDAFMRRMAFTVQFPFPEEAERLRIWNKVWPLETPRAADLDLDFMARQFKLAGGNIKNIALAAAFRAAADDQPVTMVHLIRATKREIEKMGKVCVEADFGPYYECLRTES